jgi:hypothetical protein
MTIELGPKAFEVFKSIADGFGFFLAFWGLAKVFRGLIHGK